MIRILESQKGVFGNYLVLILFVIRIPKVGIFYSISDGLEHKGSNRPSLTRNPRLATVHHLVREGRTSTFSVPMTFAGPSKQVHDTYPRHANA